MISLFKLRVYLKRIINNVLSSNKRDIREAIRHLDNTVYGDVDFIINSSVIVKYENEYNVKYFRECRKHLRLRRQILEAIEDYFNNICKHPQRQNLKLLILRDLAQNSNYKKIIHMSGIFDYCLMDILSGLYCGYNEVGLPCFNNIEAKEEFIPFIQYINCIISSQRINRYLKVGQYENNSANKQLATYELSKCLGLLGLIPNISVCKLINGDDVRIGTLMDNSGGEPPSAISLASRKKWDKGSLIKDITNLEYFDAICYQLDHRLDNYHVIKDENDKIKKVVAFDNDAARTFFVSPGLPKTTYAGANSVIRKDGSINRPYIDADFARRLLVVDKKAVFFALKNYLSKFQLKALWKRICILKKGIIISSKNNEDFLVKKWDNVDLDKMSDKQYGVTYFSLYLNDTVMLDREKAFNEIKRNRGEL